MCARLLLLLFFLFATSNAASSQAVRGQAVDRHLLGLKMAALEGNVPLPAVFADPAYSKALHYRLSTSQVGPGPETAPATLSF